MDKVAIDEDSEKYLNVSDIIHVSQEKWIINDEFLNRCIMMKMSIESLISFVYDPKAPQHRLKTYNDPYFWYERASDEGLIGENIKFTQHNWRLIYHHLKVELNGAKFDASKINDALSKSSAFDLAKFYLDQDNCVICLNYNVASAWPDLVLSYRKYRKLITSPCISDLILSRRIGILKAIFELKHLNISPNQAVYLFRVASWGDIVPYVLLKSSFYRRLMEDTNFNHQIHWILKESINNAKILKLPHVNISFLFRETRDDGLKVLDGLCFCDVGVNIMLNPQFDPFGQHHDILDSILKIDIYHSQFITVLAEKMNESNLHGFNKLLGTITSKEGAEIVIGKLIDFEFITIEMIQCAFHNGSPYFDYLIQCAGNMPSIDGIISQTGQHSKVIHVKKLLELGQNPYTIKPDVVLNNQDLLKLLLDLPTYDPSYDNNILLKLSDYSSFKLLLKHPKLHVEGNELDIISAILLKDSSDLIDKHSDARKCLEKLYKDSRFTHKFYEHDGLPLIYAHRMCEHIPINDKDTDPFISSIFAYYSAGARRKIQPDNYELIIKPRLIQHELPFVDLMTGKII